MDDADQGMEASAATIRDSVRRKNAVTLNHQQAIYTEKLRPSGLMLICHGPWLLPAVCAASLSPTSLFLSSTYFLCPVFHCFQTKQRSRRLIHWSSRWSTVEVSLKAK